MALYHFSVKQVSRGKGQTVVNSAAYISGQKLYNDYYGSFFCVVQGDFIILWDAFLATFFTVSIDSSLVLI